MFLFSPALDRGSISRCWLNRQTRNSGRAGLLSPLTVRKQPQVDGIRQRLVTGVGWVPVVSAVIESKDLTRGIRVTEHAIKVDHIVIFSAGADPRIDGLALDLVRGRKDRDWGSRNEKPFHRVQSAAENF